MPGHMSRCQRVIPGSLIFLSTVWVLGIEAKSPAWCPDFFFLSVKGPVYLFCVCVGGQSAHVLWYR